LYSCTSAQAGTSSYVGTSIPASTSIQAVTSVLGYLNLCAGTSLCASTSVHDPSHSGKPKITLEFAFKIQELSPVCSVLWFPAVDTTSFEQACRNIGQQLQIPDINDEKVDVKELGKTGLSQEYAVKWEPSSINNQNPFQLVVL
jgi:hypothetical protein